MIVSTALPKNDFAMDFNDSLAFVFFKSWFAFPSGTTVSHLVFLHINKSMLILNPKSAFLSSRNHPTWFIDFNLTFKVLVKLIVNICKNDAIIFILNNKAWHHWHLHRDYESFFASKSSLHGHEYSRNILMPFVFCTTMLIYNHPWSLYACKTDDQFHLKGWFQHQSWMALKSSLHFFRTHLEELAIWRNYLILISLQWKNFEVFIQS